MPANKISLKMAKNHNPGRAKMEAAEGAPETYMGSAMSDYVSPV